MVVDEGFKVVRRLHGVGIGLFKDFVHVIEVILEESLLEPCATLSLRTMCLFAKFLTFRALVSEKSIASAWNNISIKLYGNSFLPS
jgi:hypothetical protein